MKIFETLGYLDGIVMIGCLLGLVVISLIFDKKMTSSDDVTGSAKNFSIPLIVGATVATYMGASAGVGNMQLFLASGFSGLTPRYAWFVGWIVLCVMAGRLRASGANTLPEFISVKYGRSTQKVSSAAALIYTMSSIAGQFMACGTVFYMLGLGSVKTGIIVLGIVIIVLALFGGLKGLAITNTIQSAFIIAICVIIIPAIAIIKAGGIGGMTEYWQATDPTHLNFVAGLSPTVFIGYCVSYLLCCGAEPSYAGKFLAAKDTKTGVKGAVASMITCAILPIPMCIAAMCLPKVLPGVTDGSLFFPEMINNFMPPVVKGFAMFAFLSLFLTTGDSFLQLVSVLITNDYVKPLMPDADDKKIVRIHRTTTVLVGILAIIVGLVGGTIVDVMALGAGCYGAAVFFPLVLACYSKRHYVSRNINIAMIVGCVVTLVWNPLLSEVTGIAGVIVGAVCCMIICFIGSTSGEPDAKAEKVR